MGNTAIDLQFLIKIYIVCNDLTDLAWLESMDPKASKESHCQNIQFANHGWLQWLDKWITR